MKISIEQIKKEMPDNLTAIEEVRYIYLKLGNIMAYNRDFLNITDYRVIKNLYSNSITLSMIEKGDYQNKINATCKQHAEIVAEVINEFKKNNLDISARTIGYVEGEEKHIKVIVMCCQKTN